MMFVQEGRLGRQLKCPLKNPRPRKTSHMRFFR